MVARLYRAQGHIERAEDMHRRVLAGVSASLGAQAWQAGMGHASFAQTLETERRYDEAEGEYAQAEAILAKALGADRTRTKKVAAARVLLKSKRPLRPAATN
ncbi:MAG: hypothetical protein ABIW82_17700 [Dokdonella sp.]